MGQINTTGTTRGQWMALAAALLGWMFDGFEMGLFPLVGRDALRDLLGAAYADKGGQWFGVAIAVFLVGAATGGVFFGWLGDRIGRVRAMMLSVLAYALFTGMCGLAFTTWEIAGWRFLAAMGMGGEWSLGVALVNEIWPNRSRAFIAGLIGAAANVGFMLIAVIGLGLGAILDQARALVLSVGMPENWVETLVAHSGWRLLMFVGAVPAVLTFMIRLFVPESERWQREKDRGATSHWATRDLLGVLVGSLGAIYIILIWATMDSKPGGTELFMGAYGSLLGLLVVTVGFIYPVMRYLHRAEVASVAAANPSSDAITAIPQTQGTGAPLGHEAGATIRRMLLAACLGGVALLGTWGSLQWAPAWAGQLTEGHPELRGRELTQICSAGGAILGTIGAALIGDWLGRRLGYTILCLGSLASALFFFQFNTSYGVVFLISAFVAGGVTASFYGWLPLYLPELFRTSVRATGQGFSFNFGRILAAIGALQTGNLMGLFKEAGQPDNYPLACSIMSLIYVVGIVLIWFAPETRGKPLPE